MGMEEWQKRDPEEKIEGEAEQPTGEMPEGTVPEENMEGQGEHDTNRGGQGEAEPPEGEQRQDHT